MLRFLREHAKWLMVILGSLLMVAFLLPAGGAMFQPDHRADAIGIAGDASYNSYDRQQASQELRIIRGYLQAQARQAFLSGNSQQGQMLSFDAQSLPRDPLHWWLLQLDAGHNGIGASRQTMNHFVKEMVADPKSGLGDLLASMEVQPGQFAEALRRYQIFQLYRNVATSQSQFSKPRLRHYARDYAARVSVERLVLDASDFLTDVGQPTESEINELFEKYKDEEPGRSEPFGFGYRLPAQVKYEYLQFPFEAAVAAVKIDDLDVKARRYHKQFPNNLVDLEEKAEPKKEEPKKPEADDKPAEDKKKDDPAPLKTFKDVPFSQVRSQIVKTLKEEEARKTIDEMTKWLTAEIAKANRTLAREGRYLVLPKDRQAPDLNALAKQAQERFGVLPKVVREESRWVRVDEIDKEEGLGKAYRQLPSRRLAIGSFVRSAKELISEKARPQEAVQVNVASNLLADDEGNRYIIRLLAARKPHAPETVDPVRKKVETDARLLKAYRYAQAKADTLLGWAQEKGLEKMAHEYGKDGTFPASFNRVAEFYPKELVEGAFAVAAQARDAGGLDKLPVDSTFIWATDDSRKQIEIAKVTRHDPVDKAQFDERLPSFPRFMSQLEMREDGTFTFFGLPKFLSQESLEARLGYKSTYDGDEDKKDGDENPAQG